jgi:hypothetical protein
MQSSQDLDRTFAHAEQTFADALRLNNTIMPESVQSPDLTHLAQIATVTTANGRLLLGIYAELINARKQLEDG